MHVAEVCFSEAFLRCCSLVVGIRLEAIDLELGLGSCLFVLLDFGAFEQSLALNTCWFEWAQLGLSVLEQSLAQLWARGRSDSGYPAAQTNLLGHFLALSWLWSAGRSDSAIQAKFKGQLTS